MDQDQKRALLAVALSAVILFGWQYFFNPVNTNIPPQELSSTTENREKVLSKVSTSQNIDSSSRKASENEITDFEERFFTLSSSVSDVEISNLFKLGKGHSQLSQIDMEKVVGGEFPLEIHAYFQNSFQKLQLELVSQDEKSLKFIDSMTGINVSIQRGDDEYGKFIIKVYSPELLRLRFNISAPAAEKENKQTRDFVLFGKDVQRFKAGDSKQGELNLKWFAIDFNYHLWAMIFGDETPVTYSSNAAGDLYLDTHSKVNEIGLELVFTKKNYTLLERMGGNLHLAVDFGLFAVLAVPMLKGLQFFYDVVRNYGLAIILLTFLVRLVTFPLQYKSFKSMKKMQTIQPQLGKLREKFKDDPQRLQRESMELFKKAGANPLSGCLPLLLQLPIFIAFYKVLSNAVELMGAPFFGWISDLGEKDPFYILPILMGLAMFLQQKMTPSTSADPTQQKVMMFMPLFFTFIMKDLPAGLTLYIFVSTILGILQQVFVYKSIKE